MHPFIFCTSGQIWGFFWGGIFLCYISETNKWYKAKQSIIQYNISCRATFCGVLVPPLTVLYFDCRTIMLSSFTLCSVEKYSILILMFLVISCFQKVSSNMKKWLSTWRSQKGSLSVWQKYCFFLLNVLSSVCICYDFYWITETKIIWLCDLENKLMS